jgi:hypothetical protein
MSRLVQVNIYPKSMAIALFTVLAVALFSLTKGSKSEVDIIKENLYKLHQKTLKGNVHPDFYKNIVLQIESINRTLYEIETNLQTMKDLASK